jgi:hypothetical protein
MHPATNEPMIFSSKFVVKEKDTTNTHYIRLQINDLFRSVQKTRFQRVDLSVIDIDHNIC